MTDDIPPRNSAAWSRRWRELKQWIRHVLRCMWGRTGYRPWARVLHRLNLHHAPKHWMNDGTIFQRCEWCGLSGRVLPEEGTRHDDHRT